MSPTRRENRHSSDVGSQSPSLPAATTMRSDKQENRLTEILYMLQQSGSIAVEELASKFDVSLVTIRRDLNLLENRGQLRRNHGGAEALEPLFYEPFRNDRSFQAQVSKFAEEKRRIGRKAASFLNPNETIALTPGTTTTEVVRGIPLNCEITVVTNTVNVAMELSKRKDVNVLVTGGYLRGEWFSLVGAPAMNTLDHVVINTLFIGADGMDPAWGATCFSPDESALNVMMVKHAQRRIAVVDHSKFGVVAGCRICAPSDLHTLITDSGATDEMIAPFQKLGIEVLRV